MKASSEFQLLTNLAASMNFLKTQKQHYILYIFQYIPFVFQNSVFNSNRKKSQSKVSEL